MSIIIFAITHADFLNQAFGTNYKGYMKSRWGYSQNTRVWMVRIDNQVRDGWVNRIINESEILEEYVWNNEPTYIEETARAYRIVANIIDVPSGREYHILGKYKFDFEKSTNKKHILKKVEEI